MNNIINHLAENGILTLTLNRFDKKNALTSDMYQQLTAAFTQANLNKNIRCILLQGNEQCFCAGNDLQDFLACSQDDDLAAFAFINALAALEKPLILAVAGAAVGIGTTVLLHADYTVAATNTKFKLPFNQLGLCPEAASSLLLPQIIGHAKAFELLTLGDTFDADTALDLHLINAVCPPDQLLNHGQQIAERIVQLPHDSLLTTKKLLKHQQKALIKQAMKDEAGEFSRLMQTDTCKSILAKFFK